MNILVLGGTYFIGKILVELLLSLNHSVSVLNRGTKPLISSEVVSIVANRQDHTMIEDALRGKRFDVVIDLSGYKKNDVSLILNCLRDKIGQYIFCSSIAVCSQPPFYWPITEEHKKCASCEENEYGYNKWLAEEYLFQQFKECALAVSIVRPVYVYGPHDYSGRLDYIFSRIANDIPIFLPGNGENIIQFGYVYDLCRAIIAMIGNESAYGQAFNISGRELVTVNQFIEFISLEIGKRVDVKFNVDGQFNMNESSTLTSRHRFADINKAEKLVGIIPETSLVEGIKKTTQWWLTNRRIS